MSDLIARSEAARDGGNFDRLHAELLAEVKQLREVIQQVKELHKPFDRPVRYGSDEAERVCNYCLGPTAFPCLTVIMLDGEQS